MIKHHVLRRCLAASYLTAIGGLGHAQDTETDTPNGRLGEIVVTAERQRTELQRTALAITTLGRDTLQNLDLIKGSDLVGRVPGFFMPSRGSSSSTSLYFMRGVGQIDLYEDPAVGIYVDDVLIPRGVGSNYDLPDLQRIEVVRGPQGTLYGRNTSAGVIRYITDDPSGDFKTSLEARYGNYNDAELRASINGPIVEDGITASVSFIHHTRDGYAYDQTLNQYFNNLDLNSGRLKLKYTPSSQLSLVFAADGVIDHSSSTVYPPVLQPNGMGGQPYNPDLTWISVYPHQRFQTGGVSLTGAWDVSGAITLKSITSYRGFSGPVINVNDGGTTLIFNEAYTNYHQTDLTQELQALVHTRRFRLTAGLFYFHENYGMQRVAWAGGKTPDSGTAQYVFSDLKTDSYAAYAQTEYSLTDKLAMAVGGRYTRDRKDFADRGFQTKTNFTTAGPALAVTGVPIAGSPYDVSPSHDWNAFTPRADIRYQWSRDIMTYASYSRGYKAGSFTIRAPTLATATAPFNPEFVNTYEAGIRSEWLGGKLRVNLTGFYNDYKDLQVTAYNAALQIYSIVNAASAHTEGAEAEVTAALTRHLTWSTSAGYLQTGYSKFDSVLPGNPVGATTLVGKRLPYAPTWTLNTGPEWTMPTKVGDFHAGGDVRFTSKTYPDVYNTPQAVIPNQAFVDLSTGFSPANAPHLEVGLWVKNLFDNRANGGGGYSPTTGPNGQWYATPAFPRFFGASVRYSY